MCYYRRPDLFHVHHNIERLDGPFDEGGDVCHMLWPGWPAQVSGHTNFHLFTSLLPLTRQPRHIITTGEDGAVHREGDARRGYGGRRLSGTTRRRVQRDYLCGRAKNKRKRGKEKN